MLDVRIWRGSEKGELFAYDVPTAENQTVLDVLTWVQRHCEPALAYRIFVSRGRMRFVRHGGEWPVAMGVPEPHQGRRTGRSARHRTITTPAPYQGPCM